MDENSQEIKEILKSIDRCLHVQAENLSKAVFSKQLEKRVATGRAVSFGLMACLACLIFFAALVQPDQRESNFSRLYSGPGPESELSVDSAATVNKPDPIGEMPSQGLVFDTPDEMQKQFMVLKAENERLRRELEDQRMKLVREVVSRREIKLPEIALVEF